MLGEGTSLPRPTANRAAVVNPAGRRDGGDQEAAERREAHQDAKRQDVDSTGTENAPERGAYRHGERTGSARVPPEERSSESVRPARDLRPSGRAILRRTPQQGAKRTGGSGGSPPGPAQHAA